MTRDPKSNPKPEGGKAEREARLAQALRTNLRRRKAAPAAAVKPQAPDEPSQDRAREKEP